MTNKKRYLKFRASSLERTVTGRIGRIRHHQRLKQWDQFERFVRRQLRTGRELQEVRALQKC